MLLATLVFTSACSEDDLIHDGQEQTTPGEDDGEEGNEGMKEPKTEAMRQEEIWKGITADTSSSIAPEQATRNVWRRPSSLHWIVT